MAPSHLRVAAPTFSRLPQNITQAREILSALRFWPSHGLCGSWRDSNFRLADDSGADGFEPALTCVSAQPNMRFLWRLSSHDWSDRSALRHRREAGGGTGGLLLPSLYIGDGTHSLKDREA